MCLGVQGCRDVVFLNVLHEKPKFIFTSRPAEKCSFSQVTLCFVLCFPRLSKSRVLFPQVLKHPANGEVFIFTSPFWLHNPAGGHEQNKNDVIFTSRRFDL